MRSMPDTPKVAKSLNTRGIMGPRGKLTIIILLQEHSNKIVTMSLTPSDIVIAIDQGITQPSLEKFLIAVDGKQHRDPQLENAHTERDFGALSPKQYVFFRNPPFKAQGLCGSEGR